MTIQLDQIPGSLRKPGAYFEYNSKLANHNLPANRQTMLIIAQKMSSGSVAELIPTDVYSDVEVAEKFGWGCHCHLMAKAAINANPYLALTICAIDDAAAGVAATWTVTFASAAAASGTLRLWIGYQYVDVTITDEDAIATMATAVAAAISANPSLPVTATAALGVATLVAKNDGTPGNGIDVAYEVSNACTTATIAQTVQGSTDVDITEATEVVYAGDYDIIAVALTDSTNLEALRDHLDEVSGPLEQRPCIGIAGYDGAIGDATTLAGTLNGARVFIPYLRGTKSIPMELAAVFAALCAEEEDPAMPFDTLYMKGIHAPAIEDRLSRTEQESCLWNGVTPIEVGPGEKPQIVRAVSTYTENASGIPDPSFLDITTIRSLDYGRKAMIAMATQFQPGKATVRTLAALKSGMIETAKKLETAEIWENVDELKDKFLVEKSDTEAGTINAVIPADVVNGLHVLAARIDLIL